MKKELEFDGNSIVYDVIGSGRPVVLVHGFAEDRRVWANQVESLKARFQLIVPDLPGSGESKGGNDLSMEAMAGMIVAVIKKEGVEKCTVIGHSMGGYITLAIAEKYPELLNGFGLFHSSAFADTEEKIETRKKGIRFIKEHGGGEFLKTMIPNLFSEQSKDERPELIAQQLESASSIPDQVLVSYYEAMIQRPDRTEILRKATVPVLFTMGKYDVAIPISDGLKQCHMPEKSYIHILYHSGHMGMLEEAEKSNLLITEFLLGHDAA